MSARKFRIDTPSTLASLRILANNSTIVPILALLQLIPAMMGSGSQVGTIQAVIGSGMLLRWVPFGPS